MEQKNKNGRTNLYAVYGTLREGFGNWNWCLNNEHCRKLGTMKTDPIYKMVSLGAFPGVIVDAPKEESNQSLVLEIFEVNSKDVEQSLDRLEGYPSFYGKTTIETEWGTANMYILTNARYGDNPIVASGDWKQLVEERSGRKIGK